jgi:hypothetical protein
MFVSCCEEAKEIKVNRFASNKSENRKTAVHFPAWHAKQAQARRVCSLTSFAATEVNENR